MKEVCGCAIMPLVTELPLRKGAGTVGLGYCLLFAMILGGAVVAGFLLRAAWKVWKGERWRALAVISLFLGLYCAGVTIYLLGIVWREPPWRFGF